MMVWMRLHLVQQCVDGWLAHAFDDGVYST
jgi:hypothetical protein